MKPDCSVIVRAYNEEQHIGKLFAGIRQQTMKNIQVILVDSGSTDRTVEIAHEFEVQVVNIAPHEFTFGRSLNLGISHADADVLVFASAHIYPVYPDWLESLTAPFMDKQVAVCYGKQRGTRDSKFSEQQIFQHCFSDTSKLVQNNPFCNNCQCRNSQKCWEKHSYDESIPAFRRFVHGQNGRRKNGYQVMLFGRSRNHSYSP